jgi:hypothetical protein
MKQRSRRRYSVDAVFEDGSRVSIRDFHIATHAADYVGWIRLLNLYPGRKYRIEIAPFEVTDEDARNVNPTRRSRR